MIDASQDAFAQHSLCLPLARNADICGEEEEDAARERLSRSYRSRYKPELGGKTL